MALLPPGGCERNSTGSTPPLLPCFGLPAGEEEVKELHGQLPQHDPESTSPLRDLVGCQQLELL